VTPAGTTFLVKPMPPHNPNACGMKLFTHLNNLHYETDKPNSDYSDVYPVARGNNARLLGYGTG
jgi:hypothetical protein